MLTELPAWQALVAHRQAQNGLHITDLFEADPERFQRFSIQACDLLLDYSKNRITHETLELLLALAKAVDLPSHIDALLQGKIVNSSEQRPALHTALRQNSHTPLYVQGQNITNLIQSTLTRLYACCDAIHSGAWCGATGKAITDVVNIGIGGSDLGAKMATHALTPFHTHKIRCHFISNIDAAQSLDILQQLNAETTLFIVASKTFTTQETLLNAKMAKSWLNQSLPSGSELKRHFIAVTATFERAVNFGIPLEQCFPVWDWVGGRYSIWSAMGLPVLLSIGCDHFQEMLNGAGAMDQHFRSQDFSQNMPVILALLGIWYGNFYQAQSHAILPYTHLLQDLPAYLQQADMESNGKRTRHDGHVVTYDTGPIIWGGVGCNSQHAFHQLLLQGTHLIPADFIIPASAHHHLAEHQAMLFANCLSQTQALMQGLSQDAATIELANNHLSQQEALRLAPHLTIPGNCPSNTLVLSRLTPFTLGALLALYEHKIFVQGVIWNINSFDQWGVELGKKLSKQILQDMQGANAHLSHDASTNGLIKYYWRSNSC